MQVGLWGPEYQYVQNKIFFNENDKSGAKNNLKFIYLKKFLKVKKIKKRIITFLIIRILKIRQKKM